MKKVQQEFHQLLPKHFKILPTIDFYDTFSTTNHVHSLEKITHLIFNSPPKWIQNLFSIRNFLVQLIGITTNKPSDYHTSFTIGGYIGFFKIYEIAPNYLVLGLNDNHLDFRVLIENVHSTAHNIMVTTLVKFNNTKGKWYMKCIAPFHKIVVTRMIANAYRY